MWSLYQYADNLQGNEYASPAAYYELILACNDYLHKVKEFRKMPQVDDEICQNLISSTIRIKAWTYKTIGEIYGEAAWIDEPVGSVDAFLAQARNNVIPMNQVIDKCLNLMEAGYDGVGELTYLRAGSIGVLILIVLNVAHALHSVSGIISFQLTRVFILSFVFGRVLIWMPTMVWAMSLPRCITRRLPTCS